MLKVKTIGVPQRNPQLQLKERFPLQTIPSVWMGVMKVKVQLDQYLGAQPQPHWEVTAKLVHNNNRDEAERGGFGRF